LFTPLRWEKYMRKLPGGGKETTKAAIPEG